MATMKQIRLKRGEWQFDPNSPLGKPGGFGAVFIGVGEQHGAVAVKQLHIKANEAAHRELRIVDELLQRSLVHVIPMLDDGQDAESDSYYVIMARAERSLQEELNRVGAFPEKEAVSILHDIAAGLAEVRDIAHRDLKPANILFHEGKWKLADFGIARFVEESTSLETLKNCLTPPYAAPEQWRLERASNATDIYALGCIAYALLVGAPPFHGPDYRNQHLTMEPAPLNVQNPRLRALVANMLRKIPEGRPNIDRVMRLLDQIATEEAKEIQGEGFKELAQAGASAAEASVRADAERIASEAQQRKRQELASHAFQILQEISEAFFQRIQSVIFDAERIDDRSQLEFLHVRFGSALLHIQILLHGKPIPQSAFPISRWDVIAGATVQVAQSGERKYSWGANLWYTNKGQGEEYRWWEVMYMWHPLLRSHPYANEPFALDNLSDADAAAGPAMGKITLAAKPRPIDDENIDEFCDRWAKLFAQAYNGRLEHPQQLPLD